MSLVFAVSNIQDLSYENIVRMQILTEASLHYWYTVINKGLEPEEIRVRLTQITVATDPNTVPLGKDLAGTLNGGVADTVLAKMLSNVIGGKKDYRGHDLPPVTFGITDQTYKDGYPMFLGSWSSELGFAGIFMPYRTGNTNNPHLIMLNKYQPGSILDNMFDVHIHEIGHAMGFPHSDLTDFAAMTDKYDHAMHSVMDYNRNIYDTPNKKAYVDKAMQLMYQHGSMG
nr:hypothetical protein TetV2_00001 [Oceanusvirus sp.]